MGSKVKTLRPDKTGTFQRDGLKNTSFKKKILIFLRDYTKCKQCIGEYIFSYKLLLIEGYILFVFRGSNLK